MRIRSASSTVMNSVPPSSFTSTGSPAGQSPRFTAAKTDAQAPVPHAIVTPQPRSHTRMRSFLGERTCTNSTLTPPGKRASRSMRGPRTAIGTASASSVTSTRCGLPTETAVPTPGPSGSVTFSCVSTARPMSTATRLTAPFSIRSVSSFTPDRVFTVMCSFRTTPLSYRYLPAQRIPLPHMLASLPSALKIRISQSASAHTKRKITPSAPTPK